MGGSGGGEGDNWRYGLGRVDMTKICCIHKCGLTTLWEYQNNTSCRCNSMLTLFSMMVNIDCKLDRI